MITGIIMDVPKNEKRIKVFSRRMGHKKGAYVDIPPDTNILKTAIIDAVAKIYEVSKHEITWSEHLELPNPKEKQ